MHSYTWLLIFLPPGHCLNILSIILGGNPAYQYGIIAPTYDVAFSDAEVTFAGLFNGTVRRTVYRLGRSFTCDDESQLLYDAMGDIFTVARSLTGPIILQSPGCTEMAITLGDFARELQLPLIISTAGGAKLLDKRRYPTVLGFGPADHGSLSEGAVAMLEMYNWTTVTLLCGIQYRLANPFIATACQTLTQRLQASPQTYDINLMTFDPEKNATFVLLLQQIKNQSRIVFLFCDLEFIRPLMIVAAALDMTNGDYVFFLAQNFLYRAQLKRPWKSDPMAQTFSNSIIAYSNAPPNWTVHITTADRITQLAMANYSSNFSADFVNALDLAAYDGFSCLAAVLNDLQQPNRSQAFMTTVIRNDEVSTTQTILQLFRNRTFVLKSGSMYVSKDGFRRVNVQFMRLNNVTMDYENGWLYDVAANALTKQLPVADAWPSRTNPPRNRPRCGFRNDQCDHLRQSDTDVIAAATAAVLVIIVVGTLWLSHIFRFLRQYGHQGWHLDASALAALKEPSRIPLLSNLTERKNNPTLT